MESTNINEEVLKVSKETGIPIKKILDLIFILRSGEQVENNRLLQSIGVSKNALNLAKKLLQNLLKPPSKHTQLKVEALQEVKSLFENDYKPEETLWSNLENDYYGKSVKLLEKYKVQRPIPERKYDQFTATIETTARRASLVNFFEDVKGKRLLFLGDDDLVSVAVANFRTALEITVLDIDKRILDMIDFISKKEKLNIKMDLYDARFKIPDNYVSKFDIVFTDPPYTPEGINLFLSRSVQALDLLNQSARIYLCYGNSDRAKEKFLPIYEIFTNSGLMIRSIFDKFNRYDGAESIGSASSLFILDITPKTKSLVSLNYAKRIYTNN